VKLENKKNLAARVLNVGKSRIVFNTSSLAQIKEAITKQDIKDLVQDKLIIIKPIKGTLKKKKRKTRRRQGSIRKKPSTRKQDYVILTRKLRAHLLVLKSRSKISPENFNLLRKEIRAKSFRSLSHMKERISAINSEVNK
tara:strand:- start:7628 stop:8047 length:420 start_codon:yes stop_codon:yes gene_type:complete